MQKTEQKLIYKTDRKLATIFMGLLGFGWAVAIISGLYNGASLTDPTILLGVIVWIALVIDNVFAFYGELNESKRTFSRVTHFVFRKTLALEEIKEIRFQPIFAFSPYNRSLFVVGIHNGKQVNLYYFSDLNFSRQTLAQMAHDLKEAAPQIRYDAPAEALIKRYFPQAG
jgi:hypothetical protein